MQIPGLEDSETLGSAVSKVSDSLGGPPLHLVGRDSEASCLASLDKATKANRVCRIEYFSHGRNELTSRDVEPARLFSADGNWYLVAWCRRAEGVRTFRVDRIKSLSVTHEEAQRTLDVSTFGYRPSVDDFKAEIVLQPTAKWAIENFPTDEVEQLSDGSLRAKLSASNIDVIVRLLVTVGLDAQVVSPPWLADMAADRACRILNNYVD